MLLPLLMNLDMFSEPAPVTDFRGTATLRVVALDSATVRMASLGTATLTVTRIDGAEGEIE